MVKCAKPSVSTYRKFCFLVKYTVPSARGYRKKLVKYKSFSYLNALQYSHSAVVHRPLVLENVQAYFAIGVDVGVEHFGEELYAGRAVWVLLSKNNLKLEHA